MKLRLLSDLHQEFYHDQLVYEPLGEDVLVVAGDLAVGPRDVIRALKRFAEKIANVVYVTGNHEYYNHSMPEVDAYIRQETMGSNVHFLNPGSVTLWADNKSEPVTFIGGTLWSNFNEDAISKFACNRVINDFRIIKNFSTDKCAELYDVHSAYIKKAYSKLPGKKVIVTHFLPDVACISEQYRGPDPINGYFANNLGNWIAGTKDVPLWLFGHTHDNIDVTIGNTRCIANPYGYYRNKSYKEMVVEV